MILKHYLLIPFLFISIFLQAQAPMSERLLNQFAQSNREVSILIYLEAQADIPALTQHFEDDGIPVDQRAPIVIKLLKETAQLTQEPVITWLASTLKKELSTIHSFWVANCLYADLTKDEAVALSRLPGISWLDWNAPLASTSVEYEYTNASAPNGTEAGLLATNAPALWALGYTGYGTKVLIADTGVDPSHPALENNYQGVYSTESATWFEMNNPGGSPFDCFDHGTHVAGTVLGLDRKENDTIGMAYNAKWLGATILCGLGSIDNIACFQWALDPDNDPSTTEDIPDVINNSWYDPEVTDDCLSPYEQVLKSLEAAGVAVIFSAGNLGPEPGTIAPPHNLNYDLLNSFTVAAVNGNIVHLPVASFSSRGPSSCGGSGSLLIKPEVSAPGVDVRSCVPGGGYGLKSGTSMAAPHVSGAILLLKEAFPQLSGRQLKEALYLSAKDIGPIGEDNLYGNGMIDVLSAFQYLQSAGHIPQDPVKENDVRLLAVNHNKISCSGSFSPQIVFENSGKETVTQINWNITVTGPMQTEFNGVWTGYILSGETASFIPGDLSLPGGIYKTRYSIDYPNNLPDERPLNNILTGEVRILEKEALSVSSYPKNLPICADSEWIRHDASFSGQGIVKWFDHATNGQLLGEGASLWLDPSIGTGAYAELTHNVNTGRTEPDPTYASQSNTSGEGLRFDVLYPMTLEEITLYVVQKGLFQIIISKDKQVIANKTQLITTTGPVKIALGLYMDIGANYTILLEKGNNLQFDAAAVNYPIVIDDILHIQGPITEDSEVDAYYYFYDWKVQYADPCGRQFSEVLLTGENGYLDLNIDGPDTLAPGQEGIYTADLSESQLWSWRINKDPSVADSLLIVSIPEESKVQIGLWAVGPFGCVQNTYKDILILEQTSGISYADKTSSGWQIYPNPATESLYLSCNSSLENESDPLIHLFNAQGALVHKTVAQRINSSLFHIAPDVPPGFYILTFGQGINKAIFKIAIF